MSLQGPSIYVLPLITKRHFAFGMVALAAESCKAGMKSIGSESASRCFATA